MLAERNAALQSTNIELRRVIEELRVYERRRWNKGEKSYKMKDNLPEMNNEEQQHEMTSSIVDEDVYDLSQTVKLDSTCHSNISQHEDTINILDNGDCSSTGYSDNYSGVEDDDEHFNSDMNENNNKCNYENLQVKKFEKKCYNGIHDANSDFNHNIQKHDLNNPILRNPSAEEQHLGVHELQVPTAMVTSSSTDVSTKIANI